MPNSLRLLVMRPTICLPPRTSWLDSGGTTDPSTAACRRAPATDPLLRTSRRQALGAGDPDTPGESLTSARCLRTETGGGPSRGRAQRPDRSPGTTSGRDHQLRGSLRTLVGLLGKRIDDLRADIGARFGAIDRRMARLERQNDSIIDAVAGLGDRVAESRPRAPDRRAATLTRRKMVTGLGGDRSWEPTRDLRSR